MYIDVPLSLSYCQFEGQFWFFFSFFSKFSQINLGLSWISFLCDQLRTEGKSQKIEMSQCLLTSSHGRLLKAVLGMWCHHSCGSWFFRVIISTVTWYSSRICFILCLLVLFPQYPHQTQSNHVTLHVPHIWPGMKSEGLNSVRKVWLTLTF